MNDQQPNKIYVGSAKAIQTKYGELMKISFRRQDLETMMNNLNEKGYINLNMNARREVGQYGDTHSLVVDTWQPTQGGGQQPQQPGQQQYQQPAPAQQQYQQPAPAQQQYQQPVPAQQQYQQPSPAQQFQQPAAPAQQFQQPAAPAQQFQQPAATQPQQFQQPAPGQQFQQPATPPPAADVAPEDIPF